MRFNLPKLNAILIAISLVIIVIGFALMVGEPSGATEFNPDIFSFRRITVGPMVSLFGFFVMIFAILYTICLDVVMFRMILSGNLCASWICMLASFPSLGKFSLTLYMNTFCAPFQSLVFFWYAYNVNIIILDIV